MEFGWTDSQRKQITEENAQKFDRVLFNCQRRSSPFCAKSGFFLHTKTLDPKQAEVRIVAPEFPKEYLGPMMQIKVAYLVESVGDLLVVLCFFNPKTKFHATIGYRVFKVPFSDGNSWLDSEVKNLGNRSLFLCRNASSFSVEASDCSGWKLNCIYFMNNEHVHLRVDMDMGIFNMDDGQIEWPFDNSFNIC